MVSRCRRAVLTIEAAVDGWLDRRWAARVIVFAVLVWRRRRRAWRQWSRVGLAVRACVKWAVAARLPSWAPYALPGKPQDLGVWRREPVPCCRGLLLHVSVGVVVGVLGPEQVALLAALCLQRAVRRVLPVFRAGRVVVGLDVDDRDGYVRVALQPAVRRAPFRFHTRPWWELPPRRSRFGAPEPHLPFGSSSTSPCSSVSTVAARPLPASPRSASWLVWWEDRWVHVEWEVVWRRRAEAMAREAALGPRSRAQLAARGARAEAAAESLRGEAESAAEALGAVVSDGFVGYVREQVLADMGVGVSECAGGVVGGDDESGGGDAGVVDGELACDEALYL